MIRVTGKVRTQGVVDNASNIAGDLLTHIASRKRFPYVLLDSINQVSSFGYHSSSSYCDKCGEHREPHGEFEICNETPLQISKEWYKHVSQKSINGDRAFIHTFNLHTFAFTWSICILPKEYIRFLGPDF
jgi:hypothetical protein